MKSWDRTQIPKPFTTVAMAIAEPFSRLLTTVDDPVYGLTPPNAATQYNIGAVAGKGESGALVVGLGTFARLRSNPFFDVIRTRVVETLAPETH